MGPGSESSGDGICGASGNPCRFTSVNCRAEPLYSRHIPWSRTSTRYGRARCSAATRYRVRKTVPNSTRGATSGDVSSHTWTSSPTAR